MARKNRKKKQREKRLASQLAIFQSPESTKSQKRRAKRYLERKGVNPQRIEPIPEIISESQLEQWKNQLEPMVSEANRRIELIKFNQLYSYAVDRVREEGGGNEYFDIDNITNRNELVKEITRMRVFLNDKGSTVEGAMSDTAQVSASLYKGKFGNQYNNAENNFKRYSKELDDEAARRAFSSYRKIEEHRALEITGDGAYGSENLIIALYDAEIRGQDSLVYGEELLDIFISKDNQMWNQAKQRAEDVSAISGIIIDNITGRRNF